MKYGTGGAEYKKVEGEYRKRGVSELLLIVLLLIPKILIYLVARR